MPAGSRLPTNFKTFDFFDRASGTATSAKTLDTTTVSRLTRPEVIYDTLKPYIDAMDRFSKYKLSGVRLTNDMIMHKQFALGVPESINLAQMRHVQRALDYATSKNIDTQLYIIKGH